MNNLVTINRAEEKDIELLAYLGKETYLQSHSNSGNFDEIIFFLELNYSPEKLKAELLHSDNYFHFIYYNNKPSGFSKIIFNAIHPNIEIQNVTELDKLYLLQEFYGHKLGFELLNFNIQFSKNNLQAGMWLYVWEENHKAITFYTRNNFEIIGNHDFKISETRTNPNYHMLLRY